MGTVYLSHLTMKAVLLLSVLASALAAPETRFLCSECVDEMHNLGFLVKAGARDIRDYLAANYCPTVEANQSKKRSWPSRRRKRRSVCVRRKLTRRPRRPRRRGSAWRKLRRRGRP